LSRERTATLAGVAAYIGFYRIAIIFCDIYIYSLLGSRFKANLKVARAQSSADRETRSAIEIYGSVSAITIYLRYIERRGLSAVFSYVNERVNSMNSGCALLRAPITASNKIAVCAVFASRV